MTNKPKPKPCPFCGSDDVYDLGTVSGVWLKCDTEDCVGSGNIYDTMDLALAAWNSRPIEDALQARIAELEIERDLRKARHHGIT